ncbi:hypothetical protein [Merdimmobilis hominis]|uniref:hypothetical protein n=1 Tax=Merdimmobilis hominis TaxID=2897707 RepID=UPI0008F7FA6A|nr:hypothetical protein [Merdimmobilis hominis]
MSTKKNITIEQFYNETRKLVEADPLWEQLSRLVDYFSPDSIYWDVETLTDCGFDVVATTTFGCNEGIYCDIRLLGTYTHGGKKKMLPFATIKTLGTQREDYLKISCLGNLFCYYAMDFVSRHLDLFVQ